jgi:hypothetical protein
MSHFSDFLYFCVLGIVNIFVLKKGIQRVLRVVLSLCDVEKIVYVASYLTPKIHTFKFSQLNYILPSTYTSSKATGLPRIHT